MSTVANDPVCLLEGCVAAARAAGDHAFSQQPRRGEIHRRYAHDVKLELDRESQAAAFAVIQERFPGHTIIGEEGSAAGGEGIEWIVDPIDGTVNFFHGVPWWCSSVAVRVAGRITAGAVYSPAQDMLFAAHAESDATLNGVPVKPSPVRDPADALAVTGSEKELDPGRLHLETAQRIAPAVQKVRILGAAALDICQVAAGHVDVFCQRGLYLWDVAAAGLIVERAGGIYRQDPAQLEGRYYCRAYATAELADAFETAFPDL